jgi:hypothetical protein
MSAKMDRNAGHSLRGRNGIGQSRCFSLAGRVGPEVEIFSDATGVRMDQRANGFQLSSSPSVAAASRSDSSTNCA